MNWKTIIPLCLTVTFVQNVSPGMAQPQALNYLASMNGNVKIKRANRNSYQQPYIGAELQPTDRIRLDKKASATIRCSNLKRWQVPAGRESAVKDGCPNQGSVLIRPDSKKGPTRSGEDPTIPYLITPRSTALIERQVMLKWHDIGARVYRVRVWGEQVDWSVETNKPEAIFPGESQPIQPGEYYKVEITALDTSASSASDSVGFWFLSKAETAQIEQWVGELQQPGLPREAEVLGLAHLYRSKDLNAAAMRQLEMALESGLQTPPIYQLLGELYQSSKLQQLAKTHYAKAFDLAKAEGNLGQQAELQQSLGEVNEALAQLGNALYWFQSAQNSYLQLGDAEQVKTLQFRIDYLKERV